MLLGDEMEVTYERALIRSYQGSELLAVISAVAIQQTLPVIGLRSCGNFYGPLRPDQTEMRSVRQSRWGGDWRATASLSCISSKRVESACDRTDTGLSDNVCAYTFKHYHVHSTHSHSPPFSCVPMYSHTHPHTYTPSPSPSPTAHMHTHSVSCTLTHSHTFVHPQSHMHSHLPSLPHTLTHIHTQTHNTITHVLAHSHIFSYMHTYIHTYTLVSENVLTHSHKPSFTHTHTQKLNYTYPKCKRTHTFSLTCKTHIYTQILIIYTLTCTPLHP